MDNHYQRRKKVSMDKISQLPADILSFILSFLTMKEAARTCVLSHKWRHCWKTSVAAFHSLNIDVLIKNDIDALVAKIPRASALSCNHFSDCLVGKLLDYSNTPSLFLGTERDKFVGYVQQILHLDHCSLKDSFRLRLNVEEDFAHNIDQCIDMAMTQIRDCTHHIDKWICIAGEKSAESPNFGSSHFVIQKEIYYDGSLDYLLPCLCSSQKVGSPVKCSCLTRFSTRSLDSSGFRSLVDLQLKFVHVNRDSILSLLSNCYNLEKLCLFRCKGLVSLEISGASLKLKLLTIRLCSDLGEIEINAKNLTKFMYFGNWVKLKLVNVPRLSNVVLRTDSGSSWSTLVYASGNLSIDVPQLEFLMLSVEPTEENRIPRQLPLFTNLRTLILLGTTYGETETLWGFIPLLHASPYLRRLELHLLSVVVEEESEYSGLMEKPSEFPHPHLEEIILSGFHCHHPHFVEFVTYLLKTATNLKRLTIFSTTLWYEALSDTLDKISKEDVETVAARTTPPWEQLGNVIRPGVEVFFG